MQQTSDNPTENSLSKGINEGNLVTAIEKSGYPLQGVVADKLQDQFSVIEEWGFIDRDTSKNRSLDLFASKELSVTKDVRPQLTLLVECKRSEHPFVFFKNVTSHEIPHFPKIAGTPQDPTLTTPAGKRHSQKSPANLLGLSETSFIRPGPPLCSTFSKARLNGKKVSLSGSDPFNRMMMPIVKALDHTMYLYTQQTQMRDYSPMLVMGICVVDAPMILVESPGKTSDPTLAPWIRIYRREVHPERNRYRDVFYAVDVVHAGYLDSFLGDHLASFSEEFATRAHKQSKVLRKGGIVEDLSDWRWDEISARGT